MLLDLIYPIALILAAFCILPYILVDATRRKKGLYEWKQKFFGTVPILPQVAKGKRRVWLHGVSVGEINLLKPIVKEIAERGLEWEILISSTSKTGHELAVKLFDDSATVFCLPFDFGWSVRRALRRLKPDMLVLAELELWPRLIKECHASGVRVAVVNGRMSARSYRGYRRAKRLLATTFNRIDLIAAQDDISAEYFRELCPAPECVEVTGSIKFDGIQTDRNNEQTRRFAEMADVRDCDVVFLAGSSQSPEEAGALETFRRLQRDYPQLRLILVPRHPERFEEVAALLDKSEFAWLRRSTLSDAASLACDSDSRRVILVDTIGELSAWWGLAQVAFVGGSWGTRGGQNMLEPAGYGAAVSFGPDTRNFRRIAETLLQADAAVVVSNVDEMEAFVRRCLDSPQYRETLGKAAQALTLRNAGATRRTVDALEALFK